MSQETLVLIVRICAVALVVLIIWVIFRLLQYTTTREDWAHPKNRLSALDSDAPLPPSECTDFDADGVETETRLYRTTRLSPGFFGKRQVKPVVADAPEVDLPVAIMARSNQHFTGEDVRHLVQTFGLHRSPNATFELLSEDGRSVLFTMLNIHNPGTFPEDLDEVGKIDGVMLVMQLPNGNDAVKSYEMFMALAKEMVETCQGRLCDFKRRPIGLKELALYRTAAQNFQQEYDAWLMESQKQ